MIKHYINERELTYETLLSIGMGKMTNKLTDMFQLLIKNVSTKFLQNTDYYVIKDYVQDAFIQLMLNYKKFNYKKYPNSLAYFTEIVKRSFVQSHNIAENINNYDRYKLGNVRVKKISITMLNLR